MKPDRRGPAPDSVPHVAHVGIAVPSIAAAVPFYRDVLGIVPDAPETADGATIVNLHLGDLDAALARCRAAGYRLIDERPRPGAGGRRVAFLHPQATAGILLELTD